MRAALLKWSVLTREAMNQLLQDDPCTAAKLVLAISIRIAERMRTTRPPYFPTREPFLRSDAKSSFSQSTSRVRKSARPTHATKSTRKRKLDSEALMPMPELKSTS